MTNKLYRVSDEGMIGGVCAGVARFLGVPTKLVRILAVIFLFFGFFIITSVIYFVLMFVLDDVPAREASLQGKKPLKNALNDANSRFNIQRQRVNDLERYITSSHYDIDKQFKDLK